VNVKAQVRIRGPDASEHVLVPGDIIGRMPRAALCIEDPRISEAHALVSLRGAELKLLALRGRMSVAGRPVSAVHLEIGRRVVLSGVVGLTVLDVILPEHVYALTIIGRDGRQGAPVAFDGVMSIDPERTPSVRPSFDPAAPLTAWIVARGVLIRARGADRDQLLGPGDELAWEGLRVRVVSVPLSVRESRSTLEQGSFDNPLMLVLHYDAVHVRPAAGAPVLFDGLLARLISELAALSTPVAWSVLARVLWEGETDEQVLRYRWDQAISRIRKKLRAAMLRADLIRSSGGGLVELYLGPDDRVEDLG